MVFTLITTLPSKVEKGIHKTHTVEIRSTWWHDGRTSAEILFSQTRIGFNLLGAVGMR